MTFTLAIIATKAKPHALRLLFKLIGIFHHGFDRSLRSWKKNGHEQQLLIDDQDGLELPFDIAMALYASLLPSSGGFKLKKSGYRLMP